jgi:WD40 repeat protein
MKLTLAHDHQLPTGVLGLAVTPDGSCAFASCMDGKIYAVNTASGETTLFEDCHSSFASGCVLLPDGKTLISAGYDGILMWHDVETRRCVQRVQAHQFWSWQMALSPDGTRVATTTGQYLANSWKYEPAPESEPSVRVYDTASGKLVASFGHTPPVLSCVFSPGGWHLAAANMMGEVRVWDLHAGGEGDPLVHWTSPDFTSWGSIKSHHYTGGIYGLAFSPNGDALVGCGMGPMADPMAGNGKMTWQRWDWRKGVKIDQIKDIQQGSGLMETLAWHPDGQHFLMAGRQAQGTWNAAIFNAADGNLDTTLDTKNRISCARFASDGKTLILSCVIGHGKVKPGEWPASGKVQIYRVA